MNCKEVNKSTYMIQRAYTTESSKQQLIIFQDHCTISLIITSVINPLTPNDHYSGRTAPLNSKCCILYIYSTNIGTE